MRWWVVIWLAALATLMAACEQGPPATPKAVVPNANIPTFAPTVAAQQPSPTAAAQADATAAATAPPSTMVVSAAAIPPGSALPGSPVAASPTAQMTVLEGVKPQDGTCPSDHPVTGSLDEQTHQKLFYRPASASYEQAKPEQCFSTEQDAAAAGYQPAPN